MKYNKAHKALVPIGYLSPNLASRLVGCGECDGCEGCDGWGPNPKMLRVDRGVDEGEEEEGKEEEDAEDNGKDEEDEGDGEDREDGEEEDEDEGREEGREEGRSSLRRVQRYTTISGMPHSHGDWGGGGVLCVYIVCVCCVFVYRGFCLFYI